MTTRYLAAALVLFWITAAHAGQAKPAAPSAAKAAPSAASISNGLALFKQHCRMCHGETGAGDGPVAKTLKVQLPSLTDKTTLATLTDAEMHDLIAKGKKTERGNMPAFDRKLKGPEVQDVINFVRSLSN